LAAGELIRLAVGKLVHLNQTQHLVHAASRWARRATDVEAELNVSRTLMCGQRA